MDQRHQRQLFVPLQATAPPTTPGTPDPANTAILIHTGASQQHHDLDRGWLHDCIHSCVIPLVWVCLFAFVFIVLLVVTMPPVIDSYVSRRIDDVLKLPQHQPLANCRPCQSGANCCELDTDSPTDVHKVSSSFFVLVDRFNFWKN